MFLFMARLNYIFAMANFGAEARTLCQHLGLIGGPPSSTFGINLLVGLLCAGASLLLYRHHREYYQKPEPEAFRGE